MCITTLPAWGMLVLLHAAARSCTSLAWPAWFCKPTRMFYLRSIPWHNLALVSWQSSAGCESVSGCLRPQLGCLSAGPDFGAGLQPAQTAFEAAPGQNIAVYSHIIQGQCMYGSEGAPAARYIKSKWGIQHSSLGAVTLQPSMLFEI